MVTTCINKIIPVLITAHTRILHVLSIITDNVREQLTVVNMSVHLLCLLDYFYVPWNQIQVKTNQNCVTKITLISEQATLKPSNNLKIKNPKHV